MKEVLPYPVLHFITTRRACNFVEFTSTSNFVAVLYFVALLSLYFTQRYSPSQNIGVSFNWMQYKHFHHLYNWFGLIFLYIHHWQRIGIFRMNYIIFTFRKNFSASRRLSLNVHPYLLLNALFSAHSSPLWMIIIVILTAFNSLRKLRLNQSDNAILCARWR